MEQKKPTSTREGILQLIEKFLEEHPQLTAENFGWIALRDTTVVKRLREGGDIVTRKLDDILRYLANPNLKRIRANDTKESKAGKAPRQQQKRRRKKAEEGA